MRPMHTVIYNQGWPIFSPNRCLLTDPLLSSFSESAQFQRASTCPMAQVSTVPRAGSSHAFSRKIWSL